jgi:hypothetical protein
MADRLDDYFASFSFDLDDFEEDCGIEEGPEEIFDELDDKKESLSASLIAKWDERKQLMDSDFANAGWLLSVDPGIYDDAKSSTYDEEKRFENVVHKLFSGTTLSFSKCMEQYFHFRRKSGVFEEPSMWLSNHIASGKSHLWHSQYTHKFYPELGFVACRVTSKLLGIGSCERAWGDTKHLRSGKRCNLGAAKLEKQSVLYTAACIEAGRLKANTTGKHHWGPDDMNDKNLKEELEQFMTDESVRFDKSNLESASDSSSIVHVFCAFEEPWEAKCIKTKDAPSKFMLLKKYMNMRHIWPEEDKVASVICGTDMKWLLDASNKKKGQWACYLIPKGEKYSRRNLDEYEVHFLDDSLHACIASTNQQSHVQVVDEEDNKIEPEQHFLVRFPNTPFPGSWESFSEK